MNLMEEEYTQDQHDLNIKKWNNFKKDLKEFLDKHSATLTSMDEYNGMEEYCGTKQYLGLDGVFLYCNTVEEVLNEVLSFK